MSEETKLFIAEATRQRLESLYQQKTTADTYIQLVILTALESLGITEERRINIKTGEVLPNDD